MASSKQDRLKIFRAEIPVRNLLLRRMAVAEINRAFSRISRSVAKKLPVLTQVMVCPMPHSDT